MLPEWLQVLLSEKFFNACLIHDEVKKNEKNIFCLDCCISICPHCLSPHHSHRLLQIRRYVYHDVIRLDDAAKLMDCAFVQPYITNNSKVVFIHQRPQTRQFRGSGNICTTCDRSLQEPYLFCSISCKINHLLRTRGGVGGFIFDCEFLSLPEAGGLDEGLMMTPESVLEAVGSTRTSSESDGHGGDWCTATTEVVVRKKRSSLNVFRSICSPVSEASGNLMSRRKKTPQRAPLY